MRRKITLVLMLQKVEKTLSIQDLYLMQVVKNSCLHNFEILYADTGAIEHMMDQKS
jgi:hypothetical protein